ncbi:hypothetical protein ACFLS0_00595 [Candidatus Bipolaricaulota bacterium]
MTRHRVLVFLALVFLVAWLLEGCSTPPNDMPVISIEETDIHVSAGELRDEYEANEIAADLKYKYKMIRISGYVESIGRNIDDVAFVILVGSPEERYGVKCYFGPVDELMIVPLSPGDYVTFVGFASGNSLYHVLFSVLDVE